MGLRKYSFHPEYGADSLPPPRLASETDGFVASPVHGLQRNLWAFAAEPAEPEIKPFPGWVRLAFPLVASGVLWMAIFWSLGYLR